MHNARRRKELLVIAIITGSAVVIVNNPKYAYLMQSGPLLMLNDLDTAFKKVVIGDTARAAELDEAKMVVNGILPSGYHKSSDEQKLWYACQFVYLLVSTGWTLPTGDLERTFVQGMYSLGETLGGQIDLPEDWRSRVMAGIENIRTRHRLFL